MSFVIHVAFAYAIDLCLIAFKINVNAIFESLNIFHIYISLRFYNFGVIDNIFLGFAECTAPGLVLK